MAATSRVEDLAARCAVYIEELREFFQGRGLPCGAPGDIPQLAMRLRDPSFREEMTSMVRSVLYREEVPPSRSDLLEMLAISAGGVHFEETALPLHEPLREILNFCGEVVTAQRRGFASGETKRSAPPPEALWEPGPTQVALPGSAALQGAPAALESVDRGTPALATGQVFPNPEEPQQTAPYAAPGSSQEAEWSPAIPGANAEAELFAPASATVPALTPRRLNRLAGVLQRNYWLPGLLTLLLVMGVALFLRRPVRPAVVPVVHQPTAATIAGPKPSAYGQVVGAHRPPVATQADSPASSISSSSDSHPVRRSQPDSVSVDRPSNNAGLPSSHERALSPGRDAAVPARKESRPERRPPPTIAAVDPREGVFLASSGAMASHLLFAPAPGYPKLANFARVEGQVIVQVVVGRKGNVEATRVLEGPLLLRGAAEHAIRRWRYRPYTVDGKVTDVATIVTVSFKLRR